MKNTITTKSGKVITAKTISRYTYAIVCQMKDDNYECVSWFFKLETAEKQMKFFSKPINARHYSDFYIVEVK